VFSLNILAIGAAVARNVRHFVIAFIVVLGLEIFVFKKILAWNLFLT